MENGGVYSHDGILFSPKTDGEGNPTVWDSTDGPGRHMLREYVRQRKAYNV